MEIKTVWSVYFSATGTTEKVVTTLAKTVAQELGAQYQAFSFNLPKSREDELTFGPDDLVVMGVPVYAGRVPTLLLPYVRDKVKAQGTLAIPVVLYGNRNFDDGLMELKNVMRDNGFMPVAAGAFVGEHSFSTILGAGRPDADDMALVDELAHKAAEKVKGLTQAPTQAVEVEGCDPIRPYYTPRRAHQGLFEGQAQDRPGQVRQVRPVRPAVPHGLHRPQRRIQRGGQVHQVLRLREEVPQGRQVLRSRGLPLPPA